MENSQKLDDFIENAKESFGDLSIFEHKSAESVDLNRRRTPITDPSVLEESIIIDGIHISEDGYALVKLNKEEATKEGEKPDEWMSMSDEERTAWIEKNSAFRASLHFFRGKISDVTPPLDTLLDLTAPYSAIPLLNEFEDAADEPTAERSWNKMMKEEDNSDDELSIHIDVSEDTSEQTA